MAEPARKPWTLDEFLAFDDGTDTRHELIGGEIVAMAPPARAHVVLAGRLASRIGAALRPHCEVATEAGIIPPRRTDAWYEADVAVTCTPVQTLVERAGRCRAKVNRRPRPQTAYRPSASAS